MDAYGDSPPLWSQPTTTTFFYPHRRPRQPSPIFNPVILILAVPILILVILFFLVPPFISYTTQILHLNSVKKGWDSLIIVLVLFAILCGVFARINDDVPSSDAADQQNLNVSEVSDFTRPPPSESVSSSRWYGFSDGKEYVDNVSSTPVRVGDGGGSRLSRSCSSYPDLRQESLWENLDNRFRFFDDSELKSYRTSPAVEHFHRLPRGSEVDRGEPDTPVKVIPVDKYEVSTPPQPPTPPKSPAPRPPPPPQPPAASLKSRRSSRSVPKKEIFEKERNDDKFNENRSPPPPPPPQQPVAKSQPPEVKSEIIHRKRSGTTKEIATAITSLYSKSQRKRKKVKTRNIYDTAAALPAPPPPPPPPSKLLQNMFKKSSKNKRVHSVSNTAPPPPPPPPPPNSIFNSIFKTGSKSKRFQSSSTTAPPPPPPPPPPSSILNSLLKNGTKSRRFKNISTPSPSSPPAPPPPPEPRRYHSVNNGKPPKPNKTSSYYNESFINAPPSPLIPVRPPPPPFKMMETKFLARGDFVKISSEQSSQCSSPPPELEDSDLMSVKSEGGDSIGPSVSCPSPDVNAKAETFIARHLDEWKLDKMNSIKEKRMLGFDVPAQPYFA